MLDIFLSLNFVYMAHMRLFLLVHLEMSCGNILTNVKLYY